MFKFHQHKQEPGETVAVSEAELWKLAARCEFGEGLEEALRDCLVCGLREEVHCKRLLSEHELTLSKAMTVAQSLEFADQNARALRGSDTAIHQVYQTRIQHKGQQGQSLGQSYTKPQTRGKEWEECHHCGGADHLAAACHFADFTITN